jgi:hypothetical protein
LGGSLDNACDPVNGQCKCKPNMSGRACDKPINGYYCPTLDHLLFEVESAKRVDQRSQEFIKPNYPLERVPTWTGAGYVRVFEGSVIEFAVDSVHVSSHYELVLRYENAVQQREAWEDLRVTIVRLDGQASVEDICADYTPADDEKVARLPADATFQVLGEGPTCLEKDHRYIIKLQFVKFNANVAARDANILIDSVGLKKISYHFRF